MKTFKNKESEENWKALYFFVGVFLIYPFFISLVLNPVWFDFPVKSDGIRNYIYLVIFSSFLEAWLDGEKSKLLGFLMSITWILFFVRLYNSDFVPKGLFFHIVNHYLSYH